MFDFFPELQRLIFCARYELANLLAPRQRCSSACSHHFPACMPSFLQALEQKDHSLAHAKGNERLAAILARMFDALSANGLDSCRHHPKARNGTIPTKPTEVSHVFARNGPEHSIMLLACFVPLCQL